MCSAISRSDLGTAPGRANGTAELVFEQRQGATRLTHLYQSDPCRVLFPRAAPDAPPEAVVVTTSGGVVGGDQLRLALEAGPGARCRITTQAAEKIYRSAGPDSHLDISVRVGAGGVMEWMPQETILFDGARLRRSTEIELSNDAGLITGEIVVFGRHAHGETLKRGLVHDAWQVRREGRLVWADALHAEGELGEVFQRPATFAGAGAVASVLYAAGDGTDRLKTVRELLGAEDGDLCTGATYLGGLLIMRLLGDPRGVRRCYGALWSHLSVEPSLPRIWNN